MPVEVMPTYENVLRVWWAYSWRWFLSGAIAYLLIGFAVKFVSHRLHFDADTTGKSLIAVAFIISFLAAPQWTVRRLLTKGFGRFRLALVEK